MVTVKDFINLVESRIIEIKQDIEKHQDNSKALKFDKEALKHNENILASLNGEKKKDPNDAPKKYRPY